jgi:hypothetical protein
MEVILIYLRFEVEKTFAQLEAGEKRRCDAREP